MIQHNGHTYCSFGTALGLLEQHFKFKISVPSYDWGMPEEHLDEFLRYFGVQAVEGDRDAPTMFPYRWNPEARWDCCNGNVWFKLADDAMMFRLICEGQTHASG